MIRRLLIYNSGGGIGDSIQLLPLINTLKNELINTKFYYLSAHQNHFNSTIKDFNCNLENLNLGIKYFGFRWRHIFLVKKKIRNYNIDQFDLIIDLQSKIRNSLILKIIPHKFFISTSFNSILSVPHINIKKKKKIAYTILEAVNILLKSNYIIKEFDINNIDKKFFDESERLLPKKNYIGFSITQGNIYRKKEFPLEKIIKISKELVKINKVPVFLIEKKYQELKNKIKNDIPSALFPEHETNITSPALVTCMAKRLDFAITIDNGIMHMLSLAKIPMISLFGPTDSEKFSPNYTNSIVLDSKKLHKTKEISAISVEDVLLAAKHFLNF